MQLFLIDRVIQEEVLYVYNMHNIVEEVDGPAVNVLRRAVAEIKQRWAVIPWVTKILLSRDFPCSGRHVKPLVPAAFAVVSTHQPALIPRGISIHLMCNP
jgi:hypothetical protein